MKKIGKVLIVLFSILVSTVVMIVTILVVNEQFTPDTTSLLNKPFLVRFAYVFLPFLLGLVVFIFIFICIKKLTTRFPVLTIATVIFVIFGVCCLFKPYKIFHGDVGPYKEGQTVLTHINFGKIEPGNVVIYKGNGNLDMIGLTISASGDKAQNVRYLSGEKFMGSTVPLNYYVVRTFTTQKDPLSWLIYKKQIDFVVWFPFK